MDNIINLFSNYNRAVIFGKGPSFQNIKKTNKKDLFITINQASNEIEDVDIICINDYHNIEKIRIDVFKKVKYILIPEYFNVDCKLNKKYDHLTVKKRLNGIFTGQYIVYNRPDMERNLEFILLPTITSSCNSACDFVCSYLNKFIKKIDFYGVGIVDNNIYYHESFPVGFGTYTKSRLVSIRMNIIKVCKKNNIEFIFN
jgi:hypothetical protein